MRFFDASFLAVRAFSSSFVSATFFPAASSVKLAFSRAVVLSIAVGAALCVSNCSFDFFSTNGEVDCAAFSGWSLERGFFASLMLKPGGGPLDSPPWVEVSVAYARRGSRMAKAWVWKGKFVVSRAEWRVRADVVKEPGNRLRPENWSIREREC